MNELHLFAGAGGGILGGVLLGHTTVCAVEIEPYCRKVLLQRQRDGILPRFPIWDDIKTFDGKPWKGKVSVVAGGFPCQDISCAGKGEGIDGTRSGLWAEMARVVREVEPRFVFVENSPVLTSRGLGRVLGDLASMGYDARWGVLGACDAGAPHKRDRIWILATDANSGRRQQRNEEERAISVFDKKDHVSDSDKLNDDRAGHGTESILRERWEASKVPRSEDVPDTTGERGCGGDDAGRVEWWDTEPDVGRVANGVDHRVDRLKAIGNGQVPQVVALAWEILIESYENINCV